MIFDDDDDDDEFPEDFPEFGGDIPEEPPETQFDSTRMLKLTSGDTVVGEVVDENTAEITLVWPMELTISLIRVNNTLLPMIGLYRWGPGIKDDTVTIQKKNCIYVHDCDEDLNASYYNLIPDVYPSCRRGLEMLMMDDEEAELEKLVVESLEDVPGKGIVDGSETIDQMISRLTQKPTVH